MANPPFNVWSLVLVSLLLLAFLPSPVAAFGAGNIPSIAQIEGLNFRHGGERCRKPIIVRSWHCYGHWGYAQNHRLHQGPQVDFDDGEKSLFWQLVERVCFFSPLFFSSLSLLHLRYNDYSNADFIIVQLQSGCWCWQLERRLSPNHSHSGLPFGNFILRFCLHFLGLGAKLLVFWLCDWGIRG